MNPNFKIYKKETESIIVCQDLPPQYPPKPSLHMPLNKFTDLKAQSGSVIIVPPKLVKWPLECLIADEKKDSIPVEKISGISHITHPKKKKSNSLNLCFSLNILNVLVLIGLK